MKNFIIMVCILVRGIIIFNDNYVKRIVTDVGHLKTVCFFLPKTKWTDFLRVVLNW